MITQEPLAMENQAGYTSWKVLITGSSKIGTNDVNSIQSTEQ